jgi:hypothetical protein
MQPRWQACGRPDAPAPGSATCRDGGDYGGTLHAFEARTDKRGQPCVVGPVRLLASGRPIRPFFAFGDVARKNLSLAYRMDSIHLTGPVDGKLMRMAFMTHSETILYQAVVEPWIMYPSGM